jgi:hypothetical protein
MNGRFRVTGGCQCGAVRYAVTAPATDLYHCHCSMCRKVHGAVFGTYAVIPQDAFVIEKGQAALALFESSPGILRYFCRNCGCPIYCDTVKPPTSRVYTAATLDNGASPGHPPERERHIYAASKSCWYEIDRKLTEVAEF